MAYIILIDYHTHGQTSWILEQKIILLIDYVLTASGKHHKFWNKKWASLYWCQTLGEVNISSLTRTTVYWLHTRKLVMSHHHLTCMLALLRDSNHFCSVRIVPIYNKLVIETHHMVAWYARNPCYCLHHNIHLPKIEFVLVQSLSYFQLDLSHKGGTDTWPLWIHVCLLLPVGGWTEWVPSTWTSLCVFSELWCHSVLPDDIDCICMSHHLTQPDTRGFHSYSQLPYSLDQISLLISHHSQIVTTFPDLLNEIVATLK